MIPDAAIRIAGARGKPRASGDDPSVVTQQAAVA